MSKGTMYKTVMLGAIFLLIACSGERDLESQPLSGLHESILRNTPILVKPRSMKAMALYSFAVGETQYHLIHVEANGVNVEGTETELEELLIMHGNKTVAHRIISSERRLRLLDLDRDGVKEVVVFNNSDPDQNDFDGMEIFEISSAEFRSIHKSSPDFRPDRNFISVQHSFGYNKKTHEIKDVYHYSLDECFADYLTENRQIQGLSKEFAESLVYKYANKSFKSLRLDRKIKDRSQLINIVEKYKKAYQAADWACGC